MRKHCCAILVLALLATVGCARFRNGLHCTLEDAGDIVRADVSGALGTDMGAHVMASKFVQLKAYSYEDLYRAGVGTRSIGIREESRNDAWIGPWHPGNMSIQSDPVASLSYGLPGKLKGGRFSAMGIMAESPDEFGVGIHALLIGARIGVRPVEFIDFLGAPFGFDLLGDNLSWAERQALKGKVPSPREGPEMMQEGMEQMHREMENMREQMEHMPPSSGGSEAIQRRMDEMRRRMEEMRKRMEKVPPQQEDKDENESGEGSGDDS